MKRASVIYLTLLTILSCTIIKKPAKDDGGVKLSDTITQKITKNNTGDRTF